MIERKLGKKIKSYCRQYPVVIITGPRQSGKTTLSQMLFPDRPYISLEDPDKRFYAQTDPRGFLADIPKGAVLDEIQRVPDLLSYIQTRVDQIKKNGLFILTGSQQYEMMAKVTQSLAGRAAIARLLPFSYEELSSILRTQPLEKILFQGFYPRIYDKKLNPTEALSFYVNTYIERDVRQILNISDLGRFEIFLRLCAGRTGQILNMNSMSIECGVSHNTIKSWISVLESSFLIKLLRPYYKNLNKRLMKSPKLYFIDVGLAAYLLNIHEPQQLKSHPLKGALFETYVFSEIIKGLYNRGSPENCYFFRDHQGNEVDIVIDRGEQLDLVEAKSGQTIHQDFFRGLEYFQKLYKNENRRFIIYGGNESRRQNQVSILNWRKVSTVIKK